MDTSPPRRDGPLDSARALGASLLALLEARAELVAIEFKEETQRRKSLFMLAYVAALFLGVGLLLLAFLIVVLFWDTYRLPAILGVTVAYTGIGAWAFLRFQKISSTSPPPFSATLGEFRNDLDMLRRRDE